MTETELTLNVDKIIAFKEAEEEHSELYLEGVDKPFMVKESPDEILDILYNISNTL